MCPKSVNRDGVVEAGFCQGIFHDDAYIARLDGLRINSFAMRLENEVVTGVPLLENAKQENLLFRNRYTSVFLPLALINEDLLSFKTDVNPFEAASLAYS